MVQSFEEVSFEDKRFLKLLDSGTKLVNEHYLNLDVGKCSHIKRKQ